MQAHVPVWLHLSGAVSALAAFGGMAAALFYPDAEAAALLPVGVMGVFATTRITADKYINRL